FTDRFRSFFGGRRRRRGCGRQRRAGGQGVGPGGSGKPVPNKVARSAQHPEIPRPKRPTKKTPHGFFSVPAREARIWWILSIFWEIWAIWAGSTAGGKFFSACTEDFNSSKFLSMRVMDSASVRICSDTGSILAGTPAGTAGVS